MKATSLPARMHALIVAAGPQGITARQLCAALPCSMMTLNVSRSRARAAGLQYFGVFRSIPEGGLYYATEAWRDAGAAAWQAQVAAAEKRRQDAYRGRKSELSAEARAAKRAEQKRAQKQRARERERLAAAEAAARLATREQAQAAKPPKAKPPQKAAKLHDIGTHMRSVARDGRVVTKHQATFDRQRQATVSAAPVPVAVDYSKAKVTVCPGLGYDPRYQVAPGEKVFGAGFAAVGFGRDINTGRGWA